MKKVYFFIILLFSVYLIPSLGALDKANAQWLYLSALIVIFTRSLLQIRIERNTLLLLYLAFLVQVVISISYTKNFYISAVDISRHLTTGILILILISLLRNKTISFLGISYVITTALIYESTIALKPLVYFIKENGLNFANVNYVDIDHFKGIAGNRNITTASIVIKIPFLLYTVICNKKKLSFVASILLMFPVLALLIINSRAALLSLGIIVVLFNVFILVKNKKWIQVISVNVMIALAFIGSNIILPNEGRNTATQIASIEISNESSSNRFFLWENAVDYILKNPIIGSGIGNWKVESAAYWSSFGTSYLVPFHAHNDFLEFATELGIIGGMTYLILFVIVQWKLAVYYLKSKDNKLLILSLSFIALFVDSSLNFPFERPIIQVMFIVLLVLAIHYTGKKDEKFV